MELVVSSIEVPQPVYARVGRGSGSGATGVRVESQPTAAEESRLRSRQ